MLSRVADAIYWMQRYRERAENIARLIDVNLYLAIDAPGDDVQQWEPLLITSGDYELFREIYGTPNQENALEFLTFDERNPDSILNCLHRSRENGRSIREIITTEMWSELNTLYLNVKRAGSSSRKKITSLFEFYSGIRRSCQLFTGIMDTTMSHNQAWHFGRIGNLLERADQSTRILDVKYYILLPSVEHVGTAYDDILWGACLKSISGLEMYRKKYHELHHANVIDFVVLDREFPRGIHSCLIRARTSLKTIEDSDDSLVEPIQLTNALCQELDQGTVYEIVKTGLHEYLDQLQKKISSLSDSIYNTYFSPLPGQRVQNIEMAPPPETQNSDQNTESS